MCCAIFPQTAFFIFLFYNLFSSIKINSLEEPLRSNLIIGKKLDASQNLTFNKGL